MGTVATAASTRMRFAGGVGRYDSKSGFLTIGIFTRLAFLVWHFA